MDVTCKNGGGWVILNHRRKKELNRWSRKHIALKEPSTCKAGKINARTVHGTNRLRKDRWTTNSRDGDSNLDISDYKRPPLRATMATSILPHQSPTDTGPLWRHKSCPTRVPVTHGHYGATNLALQESQ
ncbi:hypothetical protein RRG08_046479 [Elysia crispata]|uniref:Uncharacterized protein n=1 Tax=Elysia crispata TaxID=231223 RepID=A0AAE1CZE2_9GAST|nr:hypothetical protein RRG08_046479 [Elysia crispata]